MEIYRLDPDFMRFEVVEEFESFIWSERYASFGDFEILTRPTTKNKDILRIGGYLWQSESARVMVIENIKIFIDAEGQSKMLVKGRSLEAEVLENRSTSTTKGKPEWSIKASPGYAAALLVEKICIDGADIHGNDKIPNFGVINETLGTGVTAVEVALKPQSLYKAVKDLCDSDELGFKITLRLSDKKLIFTVYKGSKKSEVTFSSMFDNLTEESSVVNRANYKNIAYVWAKDALKMEVVPAKHISAGQEGLPRRVLTVEAYDVDPAEHTAAKLKDILWQRGRQALADHRKIELFDGKLTPMNPFKYRQDYDLGDKVTLHGDLGSQETVVTEYIWVWDQEGLRSYPTFASEETGTQTIPAI